MVVGREVELLGAFREGIDIAGKLIELVDEHHLGDDPPFGGYLHNALNAGACRRGGIVRIHRHHNYLLQVGLSQFFQSGIDGRVLIAHGHFDHVRLTEGFLQAVAKIAAVDDER